MRPRAYATEVALGVECAWPVSGASDRSRNRAHVHAVVRWSLAVFVMVFGIAGLARIGHAAYIHAKAELAQVLLQRAWQRTLAGEREVKPWPWADTWPVARLVVPGRSVDLFVLAGANGRTIAFGPGHVFGTPAPGQPGNSAIGGHRDTHLAFLRELRAGDEMLIERPDGAERRYRVAGAQVLDKRDTWVLANDGPTRLTLITCYPFDAVRAGGPLRYVVTAHVMP